MVSFGWFGELWEFTITPIVVAAIHDDTTNGSAVSAYPLGGRSGDNIGSVFQGLER